MKSNWTSRLVLCGAIALVGCNKPLETVPTISTPDETTSGTSEASNASVDTAAVRFVADKSLEVPNMQCPYSCWPKVQETLAALPGVEKVQLAEQPEGTPEGVIQNKVVELKLGENFNLDSALAALAEVSFEAKEVN